MPKPSKPSAGARSTADWERIEADFRAGVKTLREIAAEHAITEGAIRKRAKRDDWDRDLAAKVQARADALVRKEMVRKASTPRTGVSEPTERETVAAGGQAVAEVVIAHQRLSHRQRGVIEKLLQQLEAEVEDADLMEQLRQAVEADAGDAAAAAKVRQVWERVASLPGLVDVARKLAETMRNVVSVERETFGLDSKSKPQEQPVRALTEAERQSRLATLMERARQAAASKPPATTPSVH